MIYRLASTPNASCQPDQEPIKDQINEALFGAGTAICTAIVIFGVVANLLVLYFGHKQPFAGPLHHINTVVKHLAVSNIFYGLLGSSTSLAYWKMGKI